MGVCKGVGVRESTVSQRTVPAIMALGT